MSKPHNNKLAIKELSRIMLGPEIGSGAYRTVYKHGMDVNLVVKLETTQNKFANILEYEVWDQVKDYPKLAKWFAPCVRISPNGLVLIQVRTTPIAPAQLPKMVPGFLTDFKAENWGMLKGKPVCHDYGNIIIGKSEKLKRADW